MEQRRADSAYQASIQAQKLDRLAGSRHHLIGTKAIPGVYSTDKRSSTSDDDQPNSEASPSPTEKLIHEHLNSPLSPHKILPPIHIPPDRLRDNPTLKEWIKTHVGVRNYKGRPIRPPAESESESAEEREKKAQGPFLVCGDLFLLSTIVEVIVDGTRYSVCSPAQNSPESFENLFIHPCALKRGIMIHLRQRRRKGDCVIG